MKNNHESKWISYKHVDFPASRVGLLEGKTTNIQTQNPFQPIALRCWTQWFSLFVVLCQGFVMSFDETNKWPWWLSDLVTQRM